MSTKNGIAGLLIFATFVQPFFFPAARAESNAHELHRLETCVQDGNPRTANYKSMVNVCNALIQTSDECKSLSESKMRGKWKSCDEDKGSWNQAKGFGSYIGHCFVGAFKSVGDLAIWLKDVAVLIAKGSLAGVEGIGHALAHPITTAQNMTRGAVMAYHSVANFFTREVAVATERAKKNPGLCAGHFEDIAALPGVGCAVALTVGPALQNMFNKVESLVASQLHQMDSCYNHGAQGEMVCRALGQFLIPPAGALAILRDGAAARFLVKQYPNIARGVGLVSREISADAKSMKEIRAAAEEEARASEAARHRAVVERAAQEEKAANRSILKEKPRVKDRAAAKQNAKRAVAEKDVATSETNVPHSLKDANLQSYIIENIAGKSAKASPQDVAKTLVREMKLPEKDANALAKKIMDAQYRIRDMERFYGEDLIIAHSAAAGGEDQYGKVVSLIAKAEDSGKYSRAELKRRLEKAEASCQLR